MLQRSGVRSRAAIVVHLLGIQEPFGVGPMTVHCLIPVGVLGIGVKLS